MNSNEYSKLALRLDQNYELVNERLYNNLELQKLMHSAIGLCGEAGEAADLIKKSLMYGKELDTEKLKKECGDVLWYMAVMLNAIGSSFEEVMRMNIEKLQARYPNGFTEQDAIQRKDTK
jgi:NTP pyrophosphatase (non-canonical NTP hydrolase)